MSLFKRGILHRVATGGGTGTGILGEVNTFSDLPASATTGDRYLVLTYSISTPTKLKGVYRWNGSSWDRQNGARAFDVVYDNSGSTLTSVNLEASTNELDTKVNGKEPSFTKNTAFNKNFGTVSGTVAEGNDSRFTNHLSSFTQNSGQYIATEGIRARDNGGVALLNDDGTGGIFVEDGGNVGIGNASPNERLHINGNFKLDVSSQFPMVVQKNGTPTSGVVAKFINNEGDHSWGVVAEFRVDGSTGTDRPSILFSQGYSSTNWTVGFGSSTDDNFRINQNHGYLSNSWGTNRFFINTSGNVGIGTTSPAEKLDVTGNTTISGKLGIGKVATDSTILDMERSETDGGGLSIRLNNSNTGSGSSHAALVLLGNNGAVQAQYYADGFGGTAYLRTYTNHPISIGTNAQERMRIEADGKVKINDRLGIGKDPGQYAVLDMEMAVTSGSGAGINLKNTASGPSYAVLNLHGNNGGVSAQYYAGGGSAVLRTYTNHGLIFGTNAAERARITNGGNFGIGTSSPSQKLHVNGNAIVSGSLSKGSGSFDIAHPDPDKKDTHRLRHYFVETPSAGGNIYKYQIKCKEGNNYIDLPDYFQFLNKDSLVWVNPFKHFGRAWGEVKDDKKIKIVAEQKGVYNILVFGDRKDEAAMKDFNKYGIEYKIKK